MWITGELVAENYRAVLIIVRQSKKLTICPLIYKQMLIRKNANTKSFFDCSQQIHVPIY